MANELTDTKSEIQYWLESVIGNALPESPYYDLEDYYAGTPHARADGYEEALADIKRSLEEAIPTIAKQLAITLAGGLLDSPRDPVALASMAVESDLDLDAIDAACAVAIALRLRDALGLTPFPNVDEIRAALGDPYSLDVG